VVDLIGRDWERGREQKEIEHKMALKRLVLFFFIVFVCLFVVVVIGLY
jgi:hypothetical protein